MERIRCTTVQVTVHPTGCRWTHQAELHHLSPGRQWVALEGLSGDFEGDITGLTGPGIRILDWVSPDPPKEPQRANAGESSPPVERSVIESELRLLDRLELPKSPPDSGMASPQQAAAWLEAFDTRRRALRERLDALDRELGESGCEPHLPRQGEPRSLWVEVDILDPAHAELHIEHRGHGATWRPRMDAEWTDPSRMQLQLLAEVFVEPPPIDPVPQVLLETGPLPPHPVAGPSSGFFGTAAATSVHPFDIAADPSVAERLSGVSPPSAFGHRPLGFRASPPETAPPLSDALHLKAWSVPVRSVIHLWPFQDSMAWLAVDLDGEDAVPAAPVRLLGPAGTTRHIPSFPATSCWVGPVPEIQCRRMVSVCPSGPTVRVRLLLEAQGPWADVPFRLEDRLPASVDPQIQVKLVDWEPMDPAFDSETGSIRFDGTLTPGHPREFSFAYRLTLPRGHRVIVVPGGDP